MGAFEVSAISAGLSYITFLKLKPLQRNFLAKSNSSDIARIQHRMEEYASQRFAEQVTLFHKDELLAQAAEAAGSAATAQLAGTKTDFLSNLLEKQFDIQADAQLAAFTRMLTPGSASNYAEKYLRMLVLFVEDLTDAYCRLYSAGLGMKQVLGIQQLVVAATDHIDVTIPLFSSPSSVDSWVNHVVTTHNIGQRRPDVLDALVLWSRDTSFSTVGCFRKRSTQPGGHSRSVFRDNANWCSEVHYPAGFDSATEIGGGHPSYRHRALD
jgi:hypothetical protein